MTAERETINEADFFREFFELKIDEILRETQRLQAAGFPHPETEQFRIAAKAVGEFIKDATKYVQTRREQALIDGMQRVVDEFSRRS